MPAGTVASATMTPEQLDKIFSKVERGLGAKKTHDLDELGREAGEVAPAAASTAAAKGEEAAKTAEQTASTAAEAPTEIA